MVAPVIWLILYLFGGLFTAGILYRHWRGFYTWDVYVAAVLAWPPIAFMLLILFLTFVGC